MGPFNSTHLLYVLKDPLQLRSFGDQCSIKLQYYQVQVQYQNYSTTSQSNYSTRPICQLQQFSFQYLTLSQFHWDFTLSLGYQQATLSSNPSSILFFSVKAAEMRDGSLQQIPSLGSVSTLAKGIFFSQKTEKMLFIFYLILKF